MTRRAVRLNLRLRLILGLKLGLPGRISLVGGFAAFVALLIAALVLYPVADHDLSDELDTSLVATASTAPGLAEQLTAKAAKAGRPPDQSTVLTVGDTLIQLLDGSFNAGDPTDLVPVTQDDASVLDGEQHSVFETIQYRGRLYRMYTAPVADGSGGIVRVARPEADVSVPLGWLRLLLEGMILGGVLAAAFGARLVAGRVLRPVRTLTDTVERVAATGDLSVRMDTRGADEIGRLARSFSAMMTALDSSVRAQRHLVADASHELRTPLTSLTTNLELLAEEGGLADPQAPSLLSAAREQSGELRMLVNDLVDLARYGESEPHREDLRLDLLAGQVVARARTRAAHLRFDTDLTECLVYADPDAIERALGNLVDNAVKWSPAGGTVRVSVTVCGDVAQAEVIDQGPGISAEDLPHVFDRFYRSAAARSKPGWGLGLSIVRQIADTHGGQASAHPTDPEPGIGMRLTLPLVH